MCDMDSSIFQLNLKRMPSMKLWRTGQVSLVLHSPTPQAPAGPPIGLCLRKSPGRNTLHT